MDELLKQRKKRQLEKKIYNEKKDQESEFTSKWFNIFDFKGNTLATGNFFRTLDDVFIYITDKIVNDPKIEDIFYIIYKNQDFIKQCLKYNHNFEILLISESFYHNVTNKNIYKTLLKKLT